MEKNVLHTITCADSSSLPGALLTTVSQTLLEKLQTIVTLAINITSPVLELVLGLGTQCRELCGTEFTGEDLLSGVAGPDVVH